MGFLWLTFYANLQARATSILKSNLKKLWKKKKKRMFYIQECRDIVVSLNFEISEKPWKLISNPISPNIKMDRILSEIKWEKYMPFFYLYSGEPNHSLDSFRQPKCVCGQVKFPKYVCLVALKSKLWKHLYILVTDILKFYEVLFCTYCCKCFFIFKKTVIMLIFPMYMHKTLPALGNEKEQQQIEFYEKWLLCGWLKSSKCFISLAWLVECPKSKVTPLLYTLYLFHMLIWR